MRDDELRKKTEQRAAAARTGKETYNWRDTPVGETREARLTDPTRLSRSDWWKDAEPEPLDYFRRTGESWLDNLRKFARSNDDRASEQQSISPHAKDRKGKDKRRAARDEGEKFEQYLPKSGDNVHSWLIDLATKLDMNLPERVNWYGALRNYVAKFKPEAKASELNQNVLASLIQMICESGEAAA
jgi:hypothetical protein